LRPLVAATSPAARGLRHTQGGSGVLVYSSELVRGSQDPRVPEDERRDMRLELARQVRDHLDADLVAEISEDIESRLATGTLNKAFYLEEYAYEGVLPATHPRRHTSILQVNEYGIVDHVKGSSSRWLERRSGGGFEFLRYVSEAVDLEQAVILTRQRQVRSFLQPERDCSPLGFRFVREDGEKISDRDKAAVARLERMLLNSGDIDDYFERQRYRRLDLDLFVTALVGDSLAGDACPVELTYTPAGKVSGWHNVAFETVRLCMESGYEGDDAIRALQIHEGSPRVAFTYEDLIYEIRNPRTALSAGGYGLSETEVVFRALAQYLNALTYNAAGIDRSAIPRGVMTLVGEYEPDALLTFQRQLNLLVSGAAQRHKIPVVAAKDGRGAVWTPMDSFNEMFFARYITLQGAIVCAVFGIDPGEVNLDSFQLRTSNLSGDDTSEKLASSRDKGLVPLLSFVAKVLNIITKLIDKRYRFEFVGLHNEDEQRKWERQKLNSTLDELRAIDGKEPDPNPMMGGAYAGNPGLNGLYLQTLQAQQAQEQGGGGEEPEGGAPQGDEPEEGDDYRVGADGRHSPYEDDGGEPPEDEHFHTLDLGKAKDVPRPRLCPHCGSRDTGLMPPDFETGRCGKCGRSFAAGATEPRRAPHGGQQRRSLHKAAEFLVVIERGT